MFDDTSETCRMCGGDGQISSSLGSTKTCPGCHGSGRRAQDLGFRDVTKTKPSHYRSSPAAAGAAAGAVADTKPTTPRTAEGSRLAIEVRDATSISAETKAKLTREIIEYEMSHGMCTKTFAKKVRKQLRATA
jgi:hypothetical protein